ncbi:MAG TPA: hypothetical protein VM240_03600 [Verrucomicrobiae bacterium]|nr:hypothetical protein [Verrucomicrobiae bacterium]
MDATPAIRNPLRRSLPLRLRAATIHFSLSLAIFAVALYLILLRWYPGFHFGVDGGWQGVRIMAAVDLVLGPLLTLVVFNPFKARKLIVFDLACIGAAQLAALAWGFHAIHGQRPVSLNFHEGTFYSMPGRSLALTAEAPAVLERISQGRLALVFVAPPGNAEERSRTARRAELKLMAHEDAVFFRPLREHWPEVQSTALAPNAVRDAAFQAEIGDFIARHGGTVADYRFFRYQGGYGTCFVGLTAAGELAGALACESQ